MNPRTALVTGASAGIGAAFADVFAARGFDLILTARRESRLRELATVLTRRHGVQFHVLAGDLADPATPGRLCGEIGDRNLTVDALVNNAGFGVPGTYTRPVWSEQAALLQVMVVAVAELTHRLLPGMIERRYGRILNVSSLAGLLPAPGGHTLYAASKAFVIRFSESLSHEVTPLGIHVTAVCPGFTLSEFHDVTGTRETVRRLPRFMWLDAETVAQQAVEAVMANQAVSVTGQVNRALALLGRYLPYPWVSAFMRRFAGSYRHT